MSNIISPLGLAEVCLYVDYDDRQEAKDLGGYRWDAVRKAWIFPAHRRGECQRLANELNERNGYAVTAEERTAAGSRSSSSSTFAGKPRDLAASIVLMFGLLPASCRKPALSALRRALHPDTGGDTQAMQALNAATKDLRLE